MTPHTSSSTSSHHLLTTSSSLYSLLLLLLFLSSFFATTPVSSWEFRFNSNHIVETRNSPTGVWGTICDDSFNLESARGLCRVMNANSNPSAVWHYNRDGTSSAGIDPSGTSGVPIWMTNLDCSGARTAGADFGTTCSFNTSYPQPVASCQHSEDVGMFCFPWTLEVESSTSVLRVRPGKTSDPLATPSGTVCSSGGAPPNKATAFALCKLAGFSASATLEFSKAWFASPGSSAASVPVYLRNINSCPVNDPLPGYSQLSLEQCQMEYLPSLTGSNTGCVGHETDIALTCTKQPSFRPLVNPTWQVDLSNSAVTGNAVKVRPNGTAPWGTICSDHMKRDTAMSICRMYGLNNNNNGVFSDINKVYASWTTSAISSHPGTGVIYVDELDCASTATSINSCQYVYSDLGSRRHDCDHREDTVVFCDEWRFAEEPGTRRLLANPQATGNTFGTVCGDGFGINEARAVCRLLGYTNGIDKVNFALYGSGADTGGANPNGRAQYMSSLSCPADATSLQACTFNRNADPSNLPAGRGLGGGCSHAFDVKIDCNGTSGTPAPEPPGFFTSEILIAIFSPLLILLLIAVFVIVRYFTNEKEKKEADEYVPRSPSSQALSGMTSAINDRSPPRRPPSSSFAPDVVTRSSSPPTNFSRNNNNNRNQSRDSSPNFEMVERENTTSNNYSPPSTSRHHTPRSNPMGVQRPLPPQAGSAVSSNPFGKSNGGGGGGGGGGRGSYVTAGYDDL